jgi:hypothetical protein
MDTNRGLSPVVAVVYCKSEAQQVDTDPSIDVEYKLNGQLAGPPLANWFNHEKNICRCFINCSVTDCLGQK